MKRNGFGRLVGLDGSKGMLQLAKNTGLYEDVRQCMLGDDQLPVTQGNGLHKTCVSVPMEHVHSLLHNASIDIG